jgi:hypothetical protein
MRKCQKRPIIRQKRPTNEQKRPIEIGIPEVCVSVIRDLAYQQKRPISWKKRPTDTLQ